jgi:hypothetical protein
MIAFQLPIRVNRENANFQKIQSLINTELMKRLHRDERKFGELDSTIVEGSNPPTYTYNMKRPNYKYDIGHIFQGVWETAVNEGRYGKNLENKDIEIFMTYFDPHRISPAGNSLEENIADNIKTIKNGFDVTPPKLLDGGIVWDGWDSVAAYRSTNKWMISYAFRLVEASYIGEINVTWMGWLDQVPEGFYKLPDKGKSKNLTFIDYNKYTFSSLRSNAEILEYLESKEALDDVKERYDFDKKKTNVFFDLSQLVNTKEITLSSAARKAKRFGFVGWLAYHLRYLATKDIREAVGEIIDDVEHFQKLYCEILHK